MQQTVGRFLWVPFDLCVTCIQMFGWASDFYFSGSTNVALHVVIRRDAIEKLLFGVNILFTCNCTWWHVSPHDRRTRTWLYSVCYHMRSWSQDCSHIIALDRMRSRFCDYKWTRLKFLWSKWNICEYPQPRSDGELFESASSNFFFVLHQQF